MRGPLDFGLACAHASPRSLTIYCRRIGRRIAVWRRHAAGQNTVARSLAGNAGRPTVFGKQHRLGLGLGSYHSDRGWHVAPMARKEWFWLLLAIGVGGVLGPLALMLGLTRTPAVTASLLLNLEAVLTALLAWIVFRENTDRRVVLLLIFAGAMLLVLPGSAQGAHLGWGALLIAGACLCWALDKQLHTRSVGIGCAVRCRTERIGRGHRQCCDRVDAGGAAARDAPLCSAMALAWCCSCSPCEDWVRRARALISPPHRSSARRSRSWRSENTPRGYSGWLPF